MLAGSYIRRVYVNGTLKVARKVFTMGEVWTQFVAMVTELLSSYCGEH